ncbi:uncharacterized protein LOC115881996 [Sitophilus oryzae]|uniref:Uncharacterized protein LOC115881996 n=1 Tax=Sitophilus oryzae TaxID=7048 RepID=A0A6J2XX59_SITOR|nr:uncharacterized protein LOC115881996 [Sitophilus oryzae]
METKNMETKESVYTSGDNVSEPSECRDFLILKSGESKETKERIKFARNENNGSDKEVKVLCLQLFQDEPMDLRSHRQDLTANHPPSQHDDRNNQQPTCSKETLTILPIKSRKRKQRLSPEFTKIKAQISGLNWSPVPTQLKSQTYPDPKNLCQEAFVYVNTDMETMNVFNRLGSRQEEVLRMAKSIFSKRTRTLYHWMYPKASKQQVKQVVYDTWETMSHLEKSVYIAQVLAKLGYTNGDLMVNPQLEQMKQMSSAASVTVNPKTIELQNAISSISKNNLQNGEVCQRLKKQKTAPKSQPAVEFEDDPELSEELAYYSVMFKED